MFAKKQLTIAIAATAALLLILTGWFVLKGNDGFKHEKQYDQIASQAVRTDAKEILINASQLQIVFDFITHSKPDTYMSPAYTALVKARPADKITDLDTSIADFATNAKVSDSVRKKLFEEVIAKRASSAMMPILLKFIASAKDPAEAQAAFRSIRGKIREEHAEALVQIIASSSHPQIIQEAEAEMKTIITTSQNRPTLAALVTTASEKTDKPLSRQSLDRLSQQIKPQPQPAPGVVPESQKLASSIADVKGKAMITLKSYISGKDSDKFTFNGTFQNDKKYVGTWTWAVWPAPGNPSQIDPSIKNWIKIRNGNFVLTEIKDRVELREDGTVQLSNYYGGAMKKDPHFWTGDTIFAVGRSVAFKMEIRQIEGHDFLIIERHDFPPVIPKEGNPTVISPDYHCGYSVYIRTP